MTFTELVTLVLAMVVLVLCIVALVSSIWRSTRPRRTARKILREVKAGERTVRQVCGQECVDLAPGEGTALNWPATCQYGYLCSLKRLAGRIWR